MWENDVSREVGWIRDEKNEGGSVTSNKMEKKRGMVCKIVEKVASLGGKQSIKGDRSQWKGRVDNCKILTGSKGKM